MNITHALMIALAVSSFSAQAAPATYRAITKAEINALPFVIAKYECKGWKETMAAAIANENQWYNMEVASRRCSEEFGAIEQKRQAQVQFKSEAKARKKAGVTLGMNQHEVIASMWGMPRYSNKTTTRYGVREQWVYSRGYLYFEDGILTAVQN